MDVMNPAPCRVHSRKGNPSMPDRRVVFTFDEASFTLLQQMTQELDFGSPAVTIREALRIVAPSRSKRPRVTRRWSSKTPLHLTSGGS